MRSRTVLLGLLAMVGLLVLGVAVLERPERGVPSPPVARNTPATPAPTVPDGVDVASWADERARTVGISARALQAYAGAEVSQRAATPGCDLSWATLAGIGQIESRHGRINGSSLVDGVAQPPIIGIALDGDNNTREIPDTDGGALDGDATHDRAVGPMQFLPQTWERFGQGDPQNIDDAARAAAAYLCSADRGLADGQGWWDGVLTYNRSVSYARDVWEAADRYASAAA
jgi:membrane-bound lytic murein transglycosylase B